MFYFQFWILKLFGVVCKHLSNRWNSSIVGNQLKKKLNPLMNDIRYDRKRWLSPNRKLNKLFNCLENYRNATRSTISISVMETLMIYFILHDKKIFKWFSSLLINLAWRVSHNTSVHCKYLRVSERRRLKLSHFKVNEERNSNFFLFQQHARPAKWSRKLIFNACLWAFWKREIVCIGTRADDIFCLTPAEVKLDIVANETN